MKMSDAWWVTDSMNGSFTVANRAKTLTRPIANCKQRRTCIQAGGNVGIYPAILARHFDRVLTLEPEAENFACLVANTWQLDNVYQVRGFLGSMVGQHELIRGKYSGGHHIGWNGPVPTYKIDNFDLTDVDAIFLDVEGYEYEALKGARMTLEMHKPLLMLEENKKLLGFGRNYGDLLELVRPLGYELSYREGEDIILECAR